MVKHFLACTFFCIISSHVSASLPDFQWREIDVGTRKASMDESEKIAQHRPPGTLKPCGSSHGVGYCKQNGSGVILRALPKPDTRPIVSEPLNDLEPPTSSGIDFSRTERNTGVRQIVESVRSTRSASPPSNMPDKVTIGTPLIVAAVFVAGMIFMAFIFLPKSGRGEGNEEFHEDSSDRVWEEYHPAGNHGEALKQESGDDWNSEQKKRNWWPLVVAFCLGASMNGCSPHSDVHEHDEEQDWRVVKMSHEILCTEVT